MCMLLTSTTCRKDTENRLFDVDCRHEFSTRPRINLGVCTFRLGVRKSIDFRLMVADSGSFRINISKRGRAQSLG